jgi:hypothetical protein
MEAAFEDRLAPLLRECAAGKNDLLFCTTEFLPSHYPRTLASAQSDELLELADEICRLRELVAEPISDSFAWRFRECCRKANDLTDHHRGSAATIAARLLDEISHSKQDILTCE